MNTEHMIPMLSIRIVKKCNCRTLVRCVLVALSVILLVSCSNSKLVLGPLYNRLDNQMRKEFNKLGKFSDEQKSAFEVRLQTFHLWHRRNELPRYAALIDEIEKAVSVPRTKTLEEVRQWSATMEGLSVDARLCHPVNFSYDLMKTLTDDQVNYIERRFAREQGINRKKYDAYSPEERLERRYKFVLKWSSRIGLDFTAEQKLLLKTALADQILLRQQYWGLSANWNRRFFVIGRDQSAADYDERMDTHLAGLWSLLETGYPKQWQANRDMWSAFFVDFTNTMTTDQREWADSWLSKLARTLRDMSDDRVDFKPGKALQGEPVGCT